MFNNVQYVPGISDNLISWSAADDNGISIKSGNSKVFLSGNEEILITGSSAPSRIPGSRMRTRSNKQNYCAIALEREPPTYNEAINCHDA